MTTTAGSWPHSTADANIVPVVANGQVFVASYKQLSIFGLGSGIGAPTPLAIAPNVPTDPSQHEMFGTISGVNGSQFTMRTRTGSLVEVDASAAMQNELCIELEAGESVDAQGTFEADSVLQASSVQRAKDSPGLWPPDL